jgi:hypothetical protein
VQPQVSCWRVGEARQSCCTELIVSYWFVNDQPITSLDAWNLSIKLQECSSFQCWRFL